MYKEICTGILDLALQCNKEKQAIQMSFDGGKNKWGMKYQTAVKKNKLDLDILTQNSETMWNAKLQEMYDIMPF